MGMQYSKVSAMDGINGRDKHLAEDLASSSAVFQRPVFQFYQAAAAHRVYVLRDLLPGHGLLGN